MTRTSTQPSFRNTLPAFEIEEDELIVDNFAGGGGASEAIEQALGRHIDIAINHDPEAVAMLQSITRIPSTCARASGK